MNPNAMTLLICLAAGVSLFEFSPDPIPRDNLEVMGTKSTRRANYWVGIAVLTGILTATLLTLRFIFR
jgi:hypothetical protein